MVENDLSNVTLVRSLVERCTKSPIVAVEWLAAVPSMMWLEERCLLFLLASEYFSGSGVIFDAGVFLGASTTAFSLGLLQRGFDSTSMMKKAQSKPIHAYELCRFAKYMRPFLAENIGNKLAEGDDFGWLLQEVLRPFDRFVELHKGDILQPLISVENVEIAFVDICKTPTINDFVVRKVFPQFIPGRTVLIHQDFFHEWLPWIKITMALFSDSFTYVGSAGSSAVFVYTEPIDKALLASFEYDQIDFVSKLKLFDVAEHYESAEVVKYLMKLSKFQLLHDEHRQDLIAGEVVRLSGVYEHLRSTGQYPWLASPAEFARNF